MSMSRLPSSNTIMSMSQFQSCANVTYKPLRTKCICTIGPASSEKQVLIELIERGMDVCRLNMAHCSHESALKIMKDIREFIQGKSVNITNIGFVVDLNGPKIRTGKLKGGKAVQLEEGKMVTFVCDKDLIGDENTVGISCPITFSAVGDTIYVADGLVGFEIVEKSDDGTRVKCLVINPGILEECKGVNFSNSPDLQDLPSLSKDDMRDIQFAIDNNIDYVAISCVRDADDVEDVRIALGSSNLKIISKIENHQSLANFSRILAVSDAIMIDRGYLGVEIDVEQVATEQKKMIELAHRAGKPVIVANQILETMRYVPRPSSAEATDVVNAILDSVDALVLSAETAVGHYPIESLQILKRIAAHAETQMDHFAFQHKLFRNIQKPLKISESVASTAVECARQVDASCIIVSTELGGTARLVAKYRPSQHVIAATFDPRTSRQMALVYGLVPFYHTGEPHELVRCAMRFAVDLGLAKVGDMIVITSGQALGFLDGTTTRMQILRIPPDVQHFYGVMPIDDTN